MALSITVKNTSGARFEMQINALTETVAEFKVRLAEASGIPAPSQRLIFRGHILKDTQTFADIKATHGLESGQSMHVVPSPRPQSAASNTPVSNPPTSAQTTPPTGNSASGPGNGTRPSGFGFPGGMPDMTEMQQQILRNPEQMQAMMNSPIMESVMNNPEIARSLMMSNPQMRELLERNPEIAHVFNDPATFRQMMQMARNPSLMNEMMRNTDRQMANIEMMPGGFDALRRMHENIQAPLMDAATGGGLMNGGNGEGNGNGNNNNNGNPFSSLFQQNTPSNAPMPNPWAPTNPSPSPTARPSATATPRGTTTNSGTNTDSTAGANAFAQLFQGMGGAGGTPGFGGAGQVPGFGNGIGMDQMLQMFEDPTMQQFMQSILSDPQMLQAMLASDPQLQARMQSNPELARMLQNPELMRAFFNPEVMRSMRQLQTAMEGALNSGNQQTPTAPTTAAGQTPSTGTQTTQNGAQNDANPTTPANPFAVMMNAMANAGTPAQNGTQNNDANPSPLANPFMAMMNAMANAGNGTANPNPAPELTQEQLEEMYSSQLAQLSDMGFDDKPRCLRALQRSRGNVSAAIESLLSGGGE